MPLREYGVLKGRAIGSRLGAGQSPHFQVHMIDDNTDYRIAINVKSSLSPSELGYVVDDAFSHPVTEFLKSIDPGFHDFASLPNSGAIDFIRGNLFDPTKMKPLPNSLTKLVWQTKRGVRYRPFPFPSTSLCLFESGEFFN